MHSTRNREPGVGIVSQRPHQTCGGKLGVDLVVIGPELDLERLRIVHVCGQSLDLAIGALHTRDLARELRGLSAHVFAWGSEVADHLVVEVELELLLVLLATLHDVSFCHRRRLVQVSRMHGVHALFGGIEFLIYFLVVLGVGSFSVCSLRPTDVAERAGYDKHEPWQQLEHSAERKRNRPQNSRKPRWTGATHGIHTFETASQYASYVADNSLTVTNCQDVQHDRHFGGAAAIRLHRFRIVTRLTTEPVTVSSSRRPYALSYSSWR